MRPTRRALLCAAVGLPIALLPVVASSSLWPLWPLYLGLFVLAAGVDALYAPRRNQVACTVELPSTLAIGETAEAILTVVVPSARPVPVTLAVDLSDLLAPQPPLHGRASRDGGRIALALRPLRRGRVSVERAWVRATGPLGLVASVVPVGLGGRSVVLPDIRPVRSTALRFASDREFRAGLKIERYRGDGSELDSLKEFAVGDDPRALDWKASARHLRLISRQHRAERNHQVVLAIDSGRLMCETVDGLPKLDHALTAALLLAYVSLRAGDRVGLYAFAAKVGGWLEPRGGVGAFPILHRKAAEIEYGESETNFTLGLTALAQRLRRRSLIVVLSDFVDTVAAELLLDNLGRLSGRHVLVFVALADPALGRAEAQPPAGALPLHRAVVAGELLRDRERVMKELRAKGIRPIDAPPALVSPQLLNAYLEIKRRESI